MSAVQIESFTFPFNDNFEDLFRRRFDASNTEYAEAMSRLVEDARAKMASDALAKPENQLSDVDADDQEQA